MTQRTQRTVTIALHTLGGVTRWSGLRRWGSLDDIAAAALAAASDRYMLCEVTDETTGATGEARRPKTAPPGATYPTTRAIRATARKALGFNPWDLASPWWRGLDQVIPLHLSGGRHVALCVLAEHVSAGFADKPHLGLSPIYCEDMTRRLGEFLDRGGWGLFMVHGFVFAGGPEIPEIPKDLDRDTRAALALRACLVEVFGNPDVAVWIEWFVCPTCGPRVAADEDGCCATCGADCTVERAAKEAP